MSCTLLLVCNYLDLIESRKRYLFEVCLAYVFYKHGAVSHQSCVLASWCFVVSHKIQCKRTCFGAHALHIHTKFFTLRKQQRPQPKVMYSAERMLNRTPDRYFVPLGCISLTCRGASMTIISGDWANKFGRLLYSKVSVRPATRTPVAEMWNWAFAQVSLGRIRIKANVEFIVRIKKRQFNLVFVLWKFNENYKILKRDYSPQKRRYWKKDIYF